MYLCSYSLDCLFIVSYMKLWLGEGEERRGRERKGERKGEEGEGGREKYVCIYCGNTLDDKIALAYYMHSKT